MAHTKVTKTYSQNTGAANTFSYSGSFDVFKATEVEVELDNVALTYTASTINESASPREYTVDTTAKTIHIGGADLSSGSVVIQPVTDMGAPTPRATYTPGASITSEDLNNNQTQLMRKAMEYDEQKLSSRGGTMTGDLTIGEDKVIKFEGATDNAYETTLTVTDPTADRTITLPNITGTVLTTADTGTVTATILAADSVNTSELVDASVTNAKLGNNAVSTAKITNDAVTGAKIADNAIDSEHYTDGSIDTAHIGNSQITTAKIANANITHDKLAEPCVQAENVGNGTLTGIKIADNQINSQHYVDGSIDTEHIADSQVTTAKIAADAITGAKIADDAIDSEHYTDGSIDTAHIGDSQVTTAKIADANVTTAKLATDAVTTVKITDANITTAKIAADAITGAKIADDAIDSEHYTDGSIDTAHIADSNVTTAKIADANVTTAKITDANVTTAKIANDAITIGKIGCEQTTISDSDSHIPTSGAVVDYVTAQIAPIGGLEVIADEDNFPTTQPASGVVISISDAGGVVVNGSGTSTTARTAGNGSDNVTINNFPSDLQSTTLAAGVGLMVTSTGSSNTYNYHKALLKEADLKNLSNDIDDFGNRYRVHSGEPSSNNDDGDLVWDTNANKMKVYDATASAWSEVTSTGDFKFLVPVDAGTTTAATWDGSDTSFDLKETTNSGSAASVSNINQLIVSLNGVIQKPNTGSYSASEEGFYLTDSDTIRFCTAPPSGSSAFIIQCGSAVSIPTPGDGTVTEAKIASAAVTQAKIAKPIDLDDNEKVRFGTGNDLDIYHDGTDSFVRTSTGDLWLQSTADDTIIRAADNIVLQPQAGEHGVNVNGNSSVELYYDSDRKFRTSSTGAVVEGATGDVQIVIHAEEDDAAVDAIVKAYTTNTSASCYLMFGDADDTFMGGLKYENNGDKLEFWVNNATNWSMTSDGHLNSGADDKQLRLGASADLKLYHDATHSWITNDTGTLVVETDQIDIRAVNNEHYIEAVKDGSVDLFYDNAKKFETTSTGVTLSGKMVAEVGSGGEYILDVKGTSDKQFGFYYDQASWEESIFRIDEFNSSGTAKKRFAIEGKAVKLYYNNTEYLSTSSGGVTVSGSLTVTGHTSSFVTPVTFKDQSANTIMYLDGNSCDLYYDGTKKCETTSSGITVQGSVNETSDVALKEDIKSLSNSLANLKQLNGYSYKFKDTGVKSLGLTAQEVEKVYPDLVEGEEGEKTLQYSGLIAPLLEAIKELSTEVETLKTKVAALEAK